MKYVKGYTKWKTLNLQESNNSEIQKLILLYLIKIKNDSNKSPLFDLWTLEFEAYCNWIAFPKKNKVSKVLETQKLKNEKIKNLSSNAIPPTHPPTHPRGGPGAPAGPPSHEVAK